ncbi:MAG: Hsp20/alpha crystallin family protein [Chloroflexi bacterium]|nr:Hsp20/alpha crystallin family protein [Chloroflexota bacterium]
MSLLRWEPMRDIMTMREAMDRLMEETLGERMPWRLEGIPLDIYDKDDSIVVKASLPGVKPENVDITVQENLLTVTAETKAEEEIKRESYYRQERRFGRFSRSVTLPVPVQADKAQATFENGTLTLRLPKAETARAKHIRVTTTGPR